MPHQDDNKTFIIDFDSTFIQVETLDELAATALEGKPDRPEIVEKISEITRLGMEGRIPFDESLRRRIALLTAEKSHVQKLTKRLKHKISPSIKRNKSFFKKHGKKILILSGGFKEIVIPIVKSYGIPEKNVFANTFIFSKSGQISGFDKKNPLSKEGGKLELIKSLNLTDEIYVLGDGHTDYQLKEAGLAHKFFAFTENVKRESVVEKADREAPNFEEFLYSIGHSKEIAYPRNRIKVCLLESIHKDAVERFGGEGYTVGCLTKGLSEDELSERIEDATVLGIRSKTKVTEEVLKHAKRLLVVGAFCIGTNQIDLKAAAKRGIAAFNAPFSNTRSVVEMAIALIISLERKLFERSAEMHQGIWQKTSRDCHEVRGKKLGIVGYGNIGSQLSVAAEMLGMEVYYFDIAEKLNLGNAKKCKSLQELLRKVDIVTLHVDGRPENKDLIGRREFQAMKPGALFLNLSRGFVVNISALAENLKSGKIQGAALDVFPEEPKGNDESFVSELISFPNVILTPHIGGSTHEAQQDIARFVSNRIIDFVNTGNSSGSVNFPNLNLPPPAKNFNRFIHIHENVPGILAKINGILAAEKINVEGQYLKTNEEIGYVITDVDKKKSRKVIDKLKNIPHTIKFRVLY